MDLRLSLENAVRHLIQVEEIANRDHLNTRNPFHWTISVLNFPENNEFDPAVPWYYKFNEVVGRMVDDCITFVDSMRVEIFSEGNFWQRGRRLSAEIQFLGNQDTSRKRKPPSLNYRAYAGCIASSNGEVVHRTVTNEKWEK